MHRSVAALLGALMLLGMLGSVGTGCGKAEAKPLEVTYYYLPG